VLLCKNQKKIRKHTVTGETEASDQKTKEEKE